MDNNIPLGSYHLQTVRDISAFSVKDVAKAFIISRDNFPILNGVTCYVLEVWEECMRVPHWHPNASEVGYVVSGTIEVMIWRSPGESAVFTLTAGMCWFIPQAALHSLNNMGDQPAQLLVGFSTESPQDIDLPVAFNGIPAPIRDTYTSPHTELRQWIGVKDNPLVGHCPVSSALKQVLTASPYGFDLAKVTPLFNDKKLGSVMWGIKSNWGILESISVLRAHLKPGTARDPIWYPDAGTLYIVSQGTAQFHIITTGMQPAPFNVNLFDFIYIPVGVLHTFINTSNSDFEVVAFFTKANPQPEVSLTVATSFFPNAVRQAAMTQYANIRQSGDPLKHLINTTVSPYLLPIKK
jgi:oxalate decarboxylase